MRLAIIAFVTTLLVMVFAVVEDIEQEKQTREFICNTINETSEYVVDDLAENGCFDNLDFINNL